MPKSLESVFWDTTDATITMVDTMREGGGSHVV